ITDSRGVCPFGWYVPTNKEWTALTTYLGGTSVAGGKLKETGTVHWASPNVGATNETGFTAIPGGLRTWDGYFMTFARWWSSTEAWSDVAYGRTMNSTNDDVYSNNLDEKQGVSVRCLSGIDSSLIETESNINDTLLLCYSMLHEYIEFSYLFDAVYANNVTAPNSSWNDIYNHSQSSTNLKVLKLWSDAFEIIYKANLVIKSAEQVISDPLTRNQIIAQAKGIRAYLNYTLLTWFGEIPLEDGFSDSLSPRNTVEEVLAWIKNDAQKAAQSLPVSWPALEKFRIPQGFATGLLSRASLYSKNWTEAVISAQQIMNTGVYTLSVGADLENFLSTNTEIFWGFEKSDNTEFNGFFTKGSYVPAIRYTESYLVSAEGLFNSGNIESAVTYTNTLKVRRGIPPEVSLTSDEIFQFWNTELAKEGSMFITLKRFDKALSIVQGNQFKLVLPVPITIINSNPNMLQNPGY
ncbi:MAG: starch-binding outer membrane protein SusD/RagB family, partial [Bacteroidota bacterium]|nr:starch-binding outer membrane protein SusD/RagB family [Bacteroidota bacterium]